MIDLITTNNSFLLCPSELRTNQKGLHQCRHNVINIMPQAGLQGGDSGGSLSGSEGGGSIYE